MVSLGDWRALGCATVEPADLEAFLGARELLHGILAEGGDNPLSEQEFGQLLDSTSAWAAACRSLTDYPMPNALLHNDLWYPNLYRSDSGFWITDWSGAMTGHPFLSVLKLLRFRSLWQKAQAPLPADEAACEDLEAAIVAEYLEPFARLDSPQRLRETLALVRSLEGPWRLFRWSRAISGSRSMARSPTSASRA